MPSSRTYRGRARAKQGHLASRRSDIYCALMGLLVALSVAIAGLWTIDRMQDEQVSSLMDSTKRLGISVGRSVAQTFELALYSGIPFDQIYGASDYLKEVLNANPELAAIRIVERSAAAATPPKDYSISRVIDSVDSGFYRPQTVEIPIVHKGQRAGTVELTLTGESTWGVTLHQYLLLAAATLLSGLGISMIARIVVAERLELPRAHLMASLSATARGNFADFSRLPGPSPVTQLSYLAERARAPVRIRAREVSYLAEELKSIDIDGSITRRVEQATQPVEECYRFDRPARLEFDHWWPGWLNLLLVLTGTMTLPLVSGFAADRVGFNLLASSAGAAALALEALGGLAGLLLALAWKQKSPLRRLIHLLAIVAAGLAISWTHYLRDLTPFLLVRPVAGFAIWFTVFSVIQAPGRSLRGPWYCGFLLLTALVVGPMTGSLVADIVGRRDAFYATGILVVLTGLPLCFVTYPAQRLYHGKRQVWRQAALVAAGVTACAGIVALYGGAVIDRHDYALLATFLGCIGVGIGVGLLLNRLTLVPFCLALAIAAIWLPYPINAVLCATLFFLGLAMGLQISQGWRRPTGLAGLTAGLFGLALGPAITLSALYLGLEAPAWITVLLLLPFLVSLIIRSGGRRPSRRGEAA